MESSDSSFLSLHRAIRDFSVLVQELADPFFENHDVTPVQYQALEFITLREKVTAKDLADFLKIKPAACSTLMNRLEKKNYILRKTSNVDRRAILLQVTEEGNRVYEKIFNHFSQMLDRVYTGLDEQEHTEFERIVRKLTDKAEKEVMNKKTSYLNKNTQL